MNSRPQFAPPPPPAAPEPPKRHEQERTNQRLKSSEGRGLSLRPSHSSASSRKPDLRRVLGGGQARDSGFTIKSTISDNRTGDSQRRLLSALERSRKPLYSEPENSSIPRDEGIASQTLAKNIEIIARRTEFGRPAIAEALLQNDNDIENAIWDLSRRESMRAWNENNDHRSRDIILHAAAAYIDYTRKEERLRRPR